MDGPLSLVTSTVGLRWSERRDLATGEDSPPIVSTSSRWANLVPTAQMSTVPLSPISTEQEIPCVNVNSGTAAPPALRSAASPDTIWDTYQDDGPVESAHIDLNWDHSSDDGSPILKIEPLDDDIFCIDDVQEAPRSSVPRSDRLSSGQPKTKRPRGRPRKHPVANRGPNGKVTKGRSKTGCITCRKRKKKCDEAKPRCEDSPRHVRKRPR